MSKNYTVDPNFEPSERLKKIAFILRNACIRRIIAKREENSRKLLDTFGIVSTNGRDAVGAAENQEV